MEIHIQMLAVAEIHGPKRDPEGLHKSIYSTDRSESLAAMRELQRYNQLMMAHAD